MLIEEAIYTLLSTDAGITAIVEDRIYPVTMPELEKGKTFYPALIFTLTNRERDQTHQGPVPLVRSHYTISCLGPQYFQVKSLAQAVRIALNGKSTALAVIYEDLVRGIFLQDEDDEYLFDEVEALALYHVPLNFLIQHWETLTG